LFVVMLGDAFKRGNEDAFLDRFSKKYNYVYYHDQL